MSHSRKTVLCTSLVLIAGCITLIVLIGAPLEVIDSNNNLLNLPGDGATNDPFMSSSDLSVSLTVTEEPDTENATRVWRADVTIECVAESGLCEQVWTDLRYSTVADETPVRIPVSETQTPASTAPFVIPLGWRDREIVVTLFNTTNELRVLYYNHTGVLGTVAQADLPRRIEALGMGDVDNDGLKEIVTGLDGTADAQLRVFRMAQDASALEQEVVSEVLPDHIEALDIGDSDNDGLNEIVVGLEDGFPPYSFISRALLYKYRGGSWSKIAVSPATDSSVEDIKIGDIDDDGENEIVVLTTLGFTSSYCRVEVFKKGDFGWHPESAVEYLQRRCERMVIGDADGDGENDILTGLTQPGELVIIDFTGGSLTGSVIGTGFYVDGLAIGNFDGDSQPDIIAGDYGNGTGRARVFEWSPASSSWVMTSITEPIGGMWDADFGDYDNDESNEVILANYNYLRAFEFGAIATSVLMTFPTTIDSALVSDIDHNEPANPRVCSLELNSSCTQTFYVHSGANSPEGSWLVSAHAGAIGQSNGSVSELHAMSTDRTAPTISQLNPSIDCTCGNCTGSTSSYRYRTFSAMVYDNVQLARAVLKSDGVVVQDRILSGTAATISYSPQNAFSVGCHNYQLQVWDASGYNTTTVTSFGVSASSNTSPTGSGGGCFLGGTPITLSNGATKSIEEIKPGERVLTFDELSGQVLPGEVTKTFAHSEASGYLVVNGYLAVTSNHPVYSGGDWVEIGSLEIGDSMLNAFGEMEPIVSLTWIEGGVSVYNLEVQPYHTYIAAGIIVHNKSLEGSVVKPE